MDKILSSVNYVCANQNWYAALMLVLTIPDICARIDYPSEKSSKKRYTLWFNKYLGLKYSHPIGADYQIHVFLSGSDCYALRCAYLHEGSSIITKQSARKVLDAFKFVIPIEGKQQHCVIWNSNGVNTLILQIDIFCADIVDGVRDWLTDVNSDKVKVDKLKKMMAFYYPFL